MVSDDMPFTYNRRLKLYKPVNIKIYMKCILDKEQYIIIYRISYLLLGSSMYAVYNGYYCLAICPSGVFLTSINYWIYPDYSWRRYLDMTCVKLLLSYQMYKAYSSQYMIPYYSLMTLAIGMYILGIYYYNKRLYWHSTYSHCMLHIISNIANILLYSGRIESACW